MQKKVAEVSTDILSLSNVDKNNQLCIPAPKFSRKWFSSNHWIGYPLRPTVSLDEVVARKTYFPAGKRKPFTVKRNKEHGTCLENTHI
jgi:hypothetical protein